MDSFGRKRHQARIRPAGLGENDFLARVRLVKQLGKMGLGLVDVDDAVHDGLWWTK